MKERPCAASQQRFRLRQCFPADCFQPARRWRRDGRAHYVMAAVTESEGDLVVSPQHAAQLTSWATLRTVPQQGGRKDPRLRAGVAKRWPENRHYLSPQRADAEAIYRFSLHPRGLSQTHRRRASGDSRWRGQRRRMPSIPGRPVGAASFRWVRPWARNGRRPHQVLQRGRRTSEWPLRCHFIRRRRISSRSRAGRRRVLAWPPSSGGCCRWLFRKETAAPCSAGTGRQCRRAATR